MTDYEEEQKSEIEALQSIYPDEFSVLQSTPFNRFTVSLKTEDYEDTEGAFCLIGFTYVPKYPDEAPVIEMVDSSNLDDNVVEELLDYLNNLAEENLGMVMVFTLISSAQEWLGSKVDELKKKRLEEIERNAKEKEEAERKKFEGTRVTVESFLSWKAAFDAEMTQLRKIQQKDECVTGRLTGRELFEHDHSLNESDIQFLQDGEEEVKVDESLFQDLEDLDLDDIPDVELSD